MNIYLAGAMSAYHIREEYHKAIEWRKEIKNQLSDCGFKIFDPTDNSEHHFKYPVSLNDGVILQNYTYLKKCDICIANLEYIEDSIGSIWEASMAWADHKPVIAFGECIRWESRPHFKNLFPIVLKDVDEVCNYITSMYNQKV